jgi:hypothetical protein
LLEAIGTLSPLRAAECLNLLQSSVASAHLKRLYLSTADPMDTCRIHLQQLESLRGLHGPAAEALPAYQAAFACLRRQSFITRHFQGGSYMAMEDILSRLPAGTRVLTLQRSLDGTVLYASLVMLVPLETGQAAAPATSNAPISQSHSPGVAAAANVASVTQKQGSKPAPPQPASAPAPEPLSRTTHVSDCSIRAIVARMRLSTAQQGELIELCHTMQHYGRVHGRSIRSVTDDLGGAADVEGLSQPAAGVTTTSTGVTPVQGRRRSTAVAKNELIASDSADEALRRVISSMTALLHPLLHGSGNEYENIADALAAQSDGQSTLAHTRVPGPVVLCVERGLSFLPLEALPALSSPLVTGVCREFSLQFCGSRLATSVALRALGQGPNTQSEAAAVGGLQGVPQCHALASNIGFVVCPRLEASTKALHTAMALADVIRGFTGQTIPTGSAITPLETASGTQQATSATSSHGLGSPQQAQKRVSAAKKSPRSVADKEAGAPSVPVSSEHTVLVSDHSGGSAAQPQVASASHNATARSQHSDVEPAGLSAPAAPSLMQLLGRPLTLPVPAKALAPNVAAANATAAPASAVGSAWVGHSGLAHPLASAAVISSLQEPVLRLVSGGSVSSASTGDTLGVSVSGVHGGAWIYLASEPLCSQVQPDAIVATGTLAAACRLAIVMELDAGRPIVGRGPDSDNDSVVDAWTTAALLSFSGVGAIVINQWAASIPATQALLHALLTPPRVSSSGNLVVASVTEELRGAFLGHDSTVVALPRVRYNTVLYGLPNVGVLHL